MSHRRRTEGSALLRAVAAALVGVASVPAHAQWAGLASYQLVNSYALPALSPNPPTATSSLQFEASAVTWNRDTNTLFMLGDGGGFVMETSLNGAPLGYMKLPAGSSPQGNEFYDIEGLAYVGSGRFVMTEERYRTAVQFSYVADSTLQRSATSTVKLGTTVGNTGLEGISYDPSTGGFILVNERAGSGASQSIFQTGIDFAALSATNGGPAVVDSAPLFAAAAIGFVTLNDVFALANISGSTNLLALTHGAVTEMTRDGTQVATLTLAGASTYPVEGMTMDLAGNLYLVSDNGDPGTSSTLFVYAPIPEPQTWIVMMAGLAWASRFRRRRPSSTASGAHPSEQRPAALSR